VWYGSLHAQRKKASIRVPEWGLRLMSRAASVLPSERGSEPLNWPALAFELIKMFGTLFGHFCPLRPHFSGCRWMYQPENATCVSPFVYRVETHVIAG
jgi:hypothetical protein